MGFATVVVVGGKDEMKELPKYAVSWFSAGVSSAVATKLVADKLDEIIYTHIDDQHPDTLRFIKDCEQWFGRKITILQSEDKGVEQAIKANGKYINGPTGAPCTKRLKRWVRKDWEREKLSKYDLTYVWGMDAGEIDRVSGIELAMPEFHHLFPLIERQIHKEEAHQILRASGIKRPAMYDLGYHNNNCVGCIKGGMGYWNKIRRDFPDVFEARAKLERWAGASCINGVFLDELDPKRGRHEAPISGECGILCGLQAI